MTLPSSRGHRPEGVIWFSVISSFASSFCAFESGHPTPYKRTCTIMFCSTVASFLFTLQALQLTRSWTKENVRWLNGGIAFSLHAITLVYLLGIKTLFRQPLGLLFACSAAGRVAYELTALRAEDHELMVEGAHEYDYFSFPNLPFFGNLPKIVTKPYRVSLGKCFYGALQEARLALDPKNNTRGDYRKFTLEEYQTPHGDSFDATMHLGIYFLFKRCEIDPLNKKVTFHGSYESHPAKAEISSIQEVSPNDDGFFDFDVEIFHASLTTLTPTYEQALTLKLSKADQKEIDQIEGTDDEKKKQTVNKLFCWIGQARLTIERKIMYQGDRDLADIIKFDSIYDKRIS